MWRVRSWGFALVGDLSAVVRDFVVDEQMIRLVSGAGVWACLDHEILGTTWEMLVESPVFEGGGCVAAS
jgi:hypothetical protein